MRDAGLQGAVAEHELELLGDEEARPEQGEEHQRDAGVGGAEPGVAEEADLEHRVVGVQLPGDERGRAATTPTPNAERIGVEPQPLVGASMSAPEQGHERGDREHRAERVEAWRRGSLEVGSTLWPATRAMMTTGR